MDKRIKEIISNFDFKLVHSVMEYLKWEWAFTKTESGVPTIGDIVIHSQRILTEVLESKEKNISITCGGFVAAKNGDTITLRFVISGWEESNE